MVLDIFNLIIGLGCLLMAGILILATVLYPNHSLVEMVRNWRFYTSTVLFILGGTAAIKMSHRQEED